MTHLQFFFSAGWWWVYLLLTLACFTIAWVSYRNTTPTLPQSIRWLLTGLRTIGLCLLLIALFEPVLRWVRSEVLRPKIVIAIDNSASMALSDNKGSRAVLVQNALKDVRNVLPDAEMVTFSDLCRNLNEPDSLSFVGQRTDMEQLIHTLANRLGAERPGAVIVLSDGNVNSGESPIYSADKSGIGWYTIGIGDSVQPADVSVQAILAPTLTVVNQPTTVSASIQSNGIAEIPITAVLYEEGTVVGKDSVIPKSINDRSMVHFSWVPKTSGHRKLTVRITTTHSEATSANNALSEYIQVNKNQQLISVFAGSPSSDLGFIQSTLEASPSITIQTFTQKHGAEFYSPLPTPQQLASSQAIMLIGFPVSSTPTDAIERIAQACSRGVSLFFVPSRETDYTKLKPLEPYLPFKVVSGRTAESLVTTDVTGAAVSDPLLRVSGTEMDVNAWNNLPPIYRTETYVQPSAGADVLATIRVNNVPLPEPLIIKRVVGNHRSLAVMGYGLYRWRLMGMGPLSTTSDNVGDVFGSFINNVTTWLSADENDKLVTIAPNRRFFNVGEVVLFKGNVLDESLTPNDGCTVRVTINGKAGNRDVVLEGIGGGRYRGTLDGLLPGDYSYRGSAVIRGKTLGTDAGRFTVGNMSLEAGSIVQNVSLLKMLASSTGAMYQNSDSAASVAKAADLDARLHPRATTSENDEVLWYTPWPLLFCIVCFATEWLLRKRMGLV